MLSEHLDYLSDAVRLERFRRAVAAVVRPGDRVADLGCGSGVLGLLCLQAGADRLYAIDDSGMIEVARRSIDTAGFGARATLLRGRCEATELPERVDVAIADHVGYFGIDYGILALFRDARKRHLRPGGRLIPERLRLSVALAGSDRLAALGRGEAGGPLPAEFQWLRVLASNTRHPVTLRTEELCSAPGVLGDIELGADHDDLLRWTLELEAARDGAIHGIAGWFDAGLGAAATMTNSPLARDAIHRPQAFLPIAEEVVVRRGDRVKLAILARPDDDLLRWRVEFPSVGRTFAHSTWEGEPFSDAQLAQSAPDRIPRLAALGRARLALLAACDGRRSIAELQAGFVRDYGALFPSPAACARFATRVLGQDTV